MSTRFRQHYFFRRDRISLSNPKGVVQMTVDVYLHQGKQLFTRWTGDARVRNVARVAGIGAAGLILSAAGLGHRPQPFAMALVSIMTGWRAAVMGLGSCCGYLLFWGQEGWQGAVWTALACLTALILGKNPMVKQAPLLLPAFSALWTAATGLGFQLAGVQVPTLVYLFRVALAWGSSQLFGALRRKEDPWLRWCAQGIGVLALGQIAPVAWLNLGCIAAGALAAAGAFPAAVLGGLALDLARVGPVPMTAVMAAVCAGRMIPGLQPWLRRLLPAGVYLLVAPMTGVRTFALLPGLVLGGVLSVYLPERTPPGRRRGEVGLVQLRLDLMAEMLSQTRLLLLEAEDTPIDEEALLARTRERACGSCPNRRTCRGRLQIPPDLLRKPMIENASLSFFCRKPGRMVLEIRRTQEQYRLLKADRDRRQEYRGALSQQYLFLSEFLREQSDTLPRRSKPVRDRFTPEVGCAARSREAENGDRFRHFSGPGGRYYLLLCDGMGTGMGAAREGRSAASLLHQMLTAGFPPAYALESLNSLLALRGRAGAVTVDLAELRLDTGTGVLYKWGAAPSYLLRDGGTEKIGTAGPPPGIRGAEAREQQSRLSLRRGETLILLSDGVEGEEVRRRALTETAAPAGELATRLLKAGAEDTADDATLAVVRLHPGDVDIISPHD